MNNDCAEVDELITELADFKNDHADMAAEKLLRKCSTSWVAYRYLLHRVHDPSLPDQARQQYCRLRGESTFRVVCATDILGPFSLSRLIH